MSSYGTGLDIGEFEAAVDLNNAYTFAVISQKKINLPLAGGYADGIIFEPYKQGQNVRLRHAGTMKVVCGGAITDGQFITTDASGFAVAAAAGNTILGKALDAGVQGQVIEILLLKMPQVASVDLAPYAKNSDVVLKTAFNQTLKDACGDATVKAALKGAVQ